MKEIVHEYTIAGRQCAICISGNDQFTDVRFLRRAHSGMKPLWLEASPVGYPVPVEDVPVFIAALQAALNEFTDRQATAGEQEEAISEAAYAWLRAEGDPVHWVSAFIRTLNAAGFTVAPVSTAEERE